MNKQTGGVRFFVVGGFLGSGKTTALIRIARHYLDRGQRVAVITNDQTHGLVDTEVVKTIGVQYREISGACFCARFRDFLEAADTLLLEAKPDVILAEPVGTCGELIATVMKPLWVYTQDRYRVMPLTVMIDPLKFEELLFENSSLSREDKRDTDPPEWSDDLLYLYKKQIEEAHLIVLTKSDITTQAQRDRVEKRLLAEFDLAHPTPVIHSMSSITGEGVEEWLNRLETLDFPLYFDRIIEFDRKRHDNAEASLGWLNLKATLTQQQSERHCGFDMPSLIEGFFVRVVDRLAGCPLGHLKVFAESNDEFLKASVVSLKHGMRLERLESPSRAESIPSDTIRMIVNFRAAIAPNPLLDLTTRSLHEIAALQQLEVEIEDCKAERPICDTPFVKIE